MAAIPSASALPISNSSVGFYPVTVSISSSALRPLPSTHARRRDSPAQPNKCAGQCVESSRKWRVGVSFFSSFQDKSTEIESLKKDLLEAIGPLDRGAGCTAEDQQRVDQIARKLEALNKVKEPLKSDLLNGKWELLYTTSKSILQPERPKFLRPNGKIYQAINVDTLRAQNMETWPFFNQATADLVPLNARRVAVKFDLFKVAALIPVKNRGSGRGQLEITYLDEELRISRGNEGNLFILKMVDPLYRVPL